MLNHVNLIVGDLDGSKAFFRSVLAPLGYKLLAEHSRSAGFGQADIEGSRDFWIKEGRLNDDKSFSCLAFTANNRQEVDNFYKAAIKAGAKDNGPPGYRPKYHPGYYAAYIIDPNGYNIEAVWDDLKKLGVGS